MKTNFRLHMAQFFFGADCGCSGPFHILSSAMSGGHSTYSGALWNMGRNAMLGTA